MKTSLFDFELPEELIADRPASPRDSARMLVVGDELQDDFIRNLPQFLKPGDVMVFNDTKVLPARLMGRRREAKVEILLHKKVKGAWQCFAKPAKRLQIGDRIDFAEDFFASVENKLPSGEVLLHFKLGDAEFRSALAQYGQMPLPPYIEKKRKSPSLTLPPSGRGDDSSPSPALAGEGRGGGDEIYYQTVYARHEGSVAAPTAGLHFTEELLSAIDALGVVRAQVTLHVGGGTFLPVKVDDTDEHVMHSEMATVSQETANIVNRAKAMGGRVIAVGTTSLRTLESATNAQGILQPFDSETAIFITPGYRFKMVDILLTNFHLPRSTLFMLVSAFSGRERMLSAYAHAIENRYRFYSYGDACLLYPQK